MVSSSYLESLKYLKLVEKKNKKEQKCVTMVQWYSTWSGLKGLNQEKNVNASPMTNIGSLGRGGRWSGDIHLPIVPPNSYQYCISI